MKILKLFFLAIITLLITSCGGDDVLSERILGTWKVANVQTVGCSNPLDDVELVDADSNDCLMFQGDELCNIVLVFTDDGLATETLSVNGELESFAFTYMTDDVNETIFLCEMPTDCSMVIIEGNRMTRTVADGSCTTTIVYVK